jgi:hypothetical protein
VSAAAEDQLELLFDRISRLTDSELMVLRSAWEEGDEAERGIAWRSVKRVVQSREREGLLDDARDRLAAWVNNYLTATAAEYGNFLISAGSGMDAATVRREALPPLLDAVAATVAADGLTGDEQAILLGPLESLDQ